MAPLSKFQAQYVFHAWSFNVKFVVFAAFHFKLGSYLTTRLADTTVKFWLISPGYEFKLEKIMRGHRRWIWNRGFSAVETGLCTSEPKNEPMASKG